MRAVRVISFLRNMDIRGINSITRFAFLQLAFVGIAAFSASSQEDRPNIVLIMADDMGYSDLGCFGGEIDTPNLDSLAENGLRFSQFYTTSKCVPTRASILTGLYQHQVGMGWMEGSNMRFPGYVGDLYSNCATIAQLLAQDEYRTYMTGKWHLTYHRYHEPDGPKHNWPKQRGFQEFYGTIHGSPVYFSLKGLTNGNRQVNPPKDLYYTDVITDHTVRYINKHQQFFPNDPFFAYVAFTAPHFPLKAKPEDIEKYLGKYMDGWEEKREDRYRRLIDMGIIDKDWPLTEKDAPDWDSLPLEEQKLWDKRMAVYAAQIDCMDQGIGKIIRALEAAGELDNTLILFLSDNGATDYVPDDYHTGYDILGTDDSSDSQQGPWANLSNTPFRRYKRQSHEGGIAAPLIAHWPAKIEARGELTGSVSHVIDIMPTILEAAGVAYPEKLGDYPLLPLEGKSLLGTLSGESVYKDRTLFFEHQGNWGIRDGDWKLVYYGAQGRRELFNMIEDRTETNDLIEAKPELAAELFAKWDAWAKRCNVYPLSNSKPWNYSQDPYKGNYNLK